MLLSQFELHLQASLMRHPDNFSRRQGHVGKSLAALDASHSDVGAQIQIGGKLSLRYGDFEWTSAGNRGHAMTPRRSYFPARRRFVGDDPTGHGNLQNRHEMRALLQVSFQGERIITGIKGTRGRRNLPHADALEIIVQMKLSLQYFGRGRELDIDRLHLFLLEQNVWSLRPRLTDSRLCRPGASLEGDESIAEF